jgi:predicted acetyltransferase
MNDLVLRPLTVGDEHAARQAHAELAAEGFEFLLDLHDNEPWATYINRLERLRRGLDVPPDRVPATFLIAEVGGELVGRTSVRHTLNPYLARVGGHVGYGVRQRARRRGHATEILQRSLDLLRRLGVERALITCDDDKVGSATVIERCGGVLQDVVDDDGVLKRRYWVKLARV